MRLRAGLLAAVAVLSASLVSVEAAWSVEPVPEKLVVLTFDDSVKSHFSVVRPILMDYGFGATFFITEGFSFREDKENYMTWEEIAQLSRDGFEIGNHTGDHKPLTAKTIGSFDEQLQVIERRCQEHRIPRPVSFAYPGNTTMPEAVEVLRKRGYLLARRGVSPEFPYKGGRGVAWEPGLDHPLLVPSAGDGRPDWGLADFRRAVRQAGRGRIAVLQFHGVPDRAHPWVHTPRRQFEAFMKYLKLQGYRVVSLRGALKYVDPKIEPKRADEVVKDRKRMIAANRSRDNFRTPGGDKSLERWLENMLVMHRFAVPEICAATGLSAEEVGQAIDRFGFDAGSQPPSTNGRIRVLPYPGGRHPRIGFRDGAMRPQRETKVSVFLPWDDSGYVVVDVPEAIWWNPPQPQSQSRTQPKPESPSKVRELLYLAHTHIATTWDRQQVILKPLEWKRLGKGALRFKRKLPGGVSFGARVEPGPDGVRMELWIRNRTKQTLTGLSVQNCVMLGSAVGFSQQTTTNKRLSSPYVACRNAAGDRWIITAWEKCQRPWGSDLCPCMHSDPKFPDCPPGETRTLRGWLSFYAGTDIDGELKRLERTDWLSGD
jgi:peptidoglycan/xylan/chitin deacetylase (PgdA/CDA1 family)